MVELSGNSLPVLDSLAGGMPLNLVWALAFCFVHFAGGVPLNIKLYCLCWTHLLAVGLWRSAAGHKIVLPVLDSKEATSKEKAPKEAASKDAASKKEASKEAASKEAAPKEEVSKEAAAKEAASKEAASSGGFPAGRL